MTARFFARVELHRASSDDYETLHTKMEGIGFRRFILDMSEKNNHMNLPTGSYARYTDGVLSEVASSIRKIADAVTTLNKVYCAKVADDMTYLDAF